MITSRHTRLKVQAFPDSGEVIITVNAVLIVASYSGEIFDPSGNKVLTFCGKGVRQHLEKRAIIPIEIWDIGCPKLYSIRLKLDYVGAESEVVSDRFGFRSVSADKENIYLNKKPFFMKGYIRGAKAHEHGNNCNLSLKDFYTKNILAAKKYGFNLIRFHSAIPPKECFEAADELGIMLHVELRRPDDEYKNVVEMLSGKKIYISDEEIQDVISSLYNHPSLMVYCIGNEIRKPGINPRVREISRLIKSLDDTRLFIDTCAHGEYDRDSVDFDIQHMGYFFPYAKHADMFENTDNLLCFGSCAGNDMLVTDKEHSRLVRKIKYNRPVVAHEICHYTALRDFEMLKRKFLDNNVQPPWWVDEELKMIQAKGYTEEYPLMVQASKYFQLSCWKVAFESLRAGKFLKGYHMLQFADTDAYENSNGVVDCFDEEHGTSEELFGRFNGDNVLIAKLPRQTFFAGEMLTFPVVYSQYARGEGKCMQDFVVELMCGNEALRSVRIKDIDLNYFGVEEIVRVEIKLPEVPKSQKMILRCAIWAGPEQTTVNEWNVWVYPRVLQSDVLSARLDMEQGYLDGAFGYDQGSNLVITDKLDDGLLELLNSGKDVILIYRTAWTRHLLDKTQEPPKYSFRHSWGRFKPVIWDRGTNMGGLADSQLLTEYGFHSDDFLDFQYYDLAEDCDKINLDDFPVKVKSIVRGIDKNARDRFDVHKHYFDLPELQYDRTLRNFSYLFELRVGKGRLMVTGFNFTNIGSPSVSAMLKTIVAYCGSDDFAPEAHITAEDFGAYLKAVGASGPQKERMMTQYWQLDNEPVESTEYWVTSKEYLSEGDKD